MELVDTELMRLGRHGQAKLAIRANVSPSTVRNAKIRGQVSKANGYQLALACGCNEEEALKIGNECSSEAKETA
jgi:hypothetical protein